MFTVQYIYLWYIDLPGRFNASNSISLTGAFPQVQAFIKSDRPKRYSIIHAVNSTLTRISQILVLDFFLTSYPGLTIKYVRGADPVIKLLDEEEEVVEVKLPFFLFHYDASLRMVNVTF
jgi:hypothetical protein